MVTTSRMLSVSVLAAALAGCTTNSERSDLVATKLVRPTGATSSTGCALDVGTAELAFGSVDPAVAKVYALGLVVENRLASNANATGRLDSNDFQIEQARMTYELPDPGFQPALQEHVVPANGFIKTGQAGVSGVQVFPADVITQLKGAGSGSVRIKVRVEGRFVDGSAAKSSQYEYTARVCAGCGTPAPTCVAPLVPVSCAPGQDSDVGCQ